MCARAELWRPGGSAAAFSASSAAAPWPSVTEDDVGSFRKWRFEARSPGPRTYPPTLRRWGRPQLRKVWASRGRIPPGVRLASDVYSPSAHLLPPAGLPALFLGGPSRSFPGRVCVRSASRLVERGLEEALDLAVVGDPGAHRHDLAGARHDDQGRNALDLVRARGRARQVAHDGVRKPVRHGELARIALLGG